MINMTDFETKIRQLVKDKILFKVRPKENRIDIIIDIPTEARIISFDENGKWLMESSITHEENGVYASRKF